MAKQYVTEAILLAVRDAAHADRVVTLFSRQLGRITAAAYGARRGKSRLGGCLQPFAVVRLSLTENGGVMPVVSQCETVQSFRPLREDIERLAYASILAEMAAELWPEHQVDATLYDMLQDAFHTMCNRNPRLTALACGWQLMAKAGFLPAYGECLACGLPLTGTGSHVFSDAMGGAVCSGCQDGPAASFSPNMAALLEKMLYLNWREPGQFSVTAGTLAAMECVFASYVTYYLERPLKSLAFIRQMEACQLGHK